MWVNAETGERVSLNSLSVEEVKEDEGFQETAKVRRRHQACARPVTLPTGALDDARKGILRHFTSEPFPAVFSAVGHPSHSSLIACACFSTAPTPLFPS